LISYEREGKRFKYRVAGLCIHEGHVLLTKAELDDYWILPGGRVELLEDTRTTLHRELIEEIGQKMEVKDLLWILENFFHRDETNYHELSFIYTVSPTNSTILKNSWTHRTRDGEVEIELQWFDLNHLEHTNFQPQILKPLLTTLPQTPNHIIVREP
jgi:ADP-ribose pyrophosphatase YjhB (NUDIX family)